MNDVLKNEAAKLFDLPKVDDKRIQSCLYALGFRQTCGRCGGTGRYSYNQMDGDRCYGCQGKKNVAVKLTRKVLDDARVKVEAGDLARAREAAKRKIEARTSIEGLVERAYAIYKTIGDAYTRNSGGFGSPLYLAQTMNNSIFWDYIKDIARSAEFGYRKDFETCVARIVEATALLVELRDAWLRFDAERKANTEREIYGATLAEIADHDRMLDSMYP